MLRLRRSLFLLLTVWFLCCSGLVHVMVRAQNRTRPTTHPDDGLSFQHLTKV
ncbi:hypothetical protein AtEden1_Chr1g0055451 [Arabidopsis thaliana]